jgi:hypothetical protein
MEPSFQPARESGPLLKRGIWRLSFHQATTAMMPAGIVRRGGSPLSIPETGGGDKAAPRFPRAGRRRSSTAICRPLRDLHTAQDDGFFCLQPQPKTIPCFIDSSLSEAS